MMPVCPAGHSMRSATNPTSSRRFGASSRPEMSIAADPNVPARICRDPAGRPGRRRPRARGGSRRATGTRTPVTAGGAWDRAGRDRASRQGGPPAPGPPERIRGWTPGARAARRRDRRPALCRRRLRAQPRLRGGRVGNRGTQTGADRADHRRAPRPRVPGAACPPRGDPRSARRPATPRRTGHRTGSDADRLRRIVGPGHVRARSAEARVLQPRDKPRAAGGARALSNTARSRGRAGLSERRRRSGQDPLGSRAPATEADLSRQAARP